MNPDAFAAALLDPARPAPEGLTGPGGRPAGRRFDVYRNNVAVSLAEALETGFPATRRLVGAEFFRAMAGVFLRLHPPAGPLMMLYGAALPGFLETFAPVAHLPYLPDVARLEQALRESYHEADAPPVAPAALAKVAPEALPGLRLRIAPALRLIRSAHPVHAIWHANAAREDGAARSAGPRPPARKIAGGAQAVLVTRPGFDPVAEPLAPAEGALAAALIAGRTLAAAAEAAPGADPGTVLARLLSRDAVTELIQ